jgi:hypothetical protein|tara:strand:+ start:254 stop:544 length:291 start_codon:yes stop_codon:yes gene_type:complete
MNMNLDRIVAIATDLKNDTEWVNDSHSEYEHKGVVHGLDRLISHLKETEPTDVEKFSQTPLFEWFNNFVDYVGNKNNNLYNEACKYADEREEDSNA